jgi:hypothetical protein
VNIASNLWGRLGKAVFVKGGAAKLAHSPLVAGPLYGREVTSNANRLNFPFPHHSLPPKLAPRPFHS